MSHGVKSGKQRPDLKRVTGRRRQRSLELPPVTRAQRGRVQHPLVISWEVLGEKKKNDFVRATVSSFSRGSRKGFLIATCCQQTRRCRNGLNISLLAQELLAGGAVTRGHWSHRAEGLTGLPKGLRAREQPRFHDFFFFFK